jgi:hypothetical protein
MRQKAGSEDKAELQAPTSTDQAFPHRIPEKTKAQQQSRMRARLPQGTLALTVTRCY